jgi:hypothetical protein
VRIALNGFTKEWEVFVKCVVGRDHLLDWSILWDDFRRRFRKDLKVVNIRQMELMRMFLLLQRARRKEVLEGT